MSDPYSAWVDESGSREEALADLEEVAHVEVPESLAKRLTDEIANIPRVKCQDHFTCAQALKATGYCEDCKRHA